MIGKILSFLLKYPLQLLLAAVVVVLGIQTLRLKAAQAHVRSLGFEKLEAEARADSTRKVGQKVALALIKMYGENYRGVEKLIVQVKRENSELSKALGQQTTLVANLTVQLQDLSTTTTSGPVVTDSSDVRHAVFLTDTIPPYHVRDSVSLPPAPKPGTSKLWIRMDPFTVDAHAGCSNEKDAQGLRKASLTVAAPAYATITLGALTQDREVCNPASQAQGTSLKVPWWFVPVGSLLTLLGVAIAP